MWRLMEFERFMKNTAFEDLSGRRFGRLTALHRDTSATGRSKWICICDCGAIVSVISSNLKRGSTKSCGCLQRELLSKRATTHGGWKEKDSLYEVWHGMKRRCYSKSDSHYKDYGARGIDICDEWREDYSKFREWAIENGYQKGLSIDRIDVNSGYSPGNCRWATSYVQQNNRRSCRYYTHDGETLTLKQWSKKLGINYQTLYSRITRCGMDFEKAISVKTD